MAMIPMGRKARERGRIERETHKLGPFSSCPAIRRETPKGRDYIEEEESNESNGRGNPNIDHGMTKELRKKVFTP